MRRGNILKTYMINEYTRPVRGTQCAVSRTQIEKNSKTGKKTT